MSERVVVIGSGLGGLECGFILAKAGMQVTVLEKEHQTGGCLQTFMRGGQRFDTGLHYVGGLNEGGSLRPLFDYFGLMDLPWKRLDEDCFDQICIGNRRFAFAQGHERFVETLAESFPKEKENLKTYAEMLYYMNDEEDKVGRTFKFTFDGSGKKTIVNCEFNLEQGKVSLGDGVFSHQFMYSATLNAAPGEWDAVFASKEAFTKGCMVSLYIRDSENGGYTKAWAEMSEGDIKKQFESVEGCKYYTREEIADIFWNLHENMLKSLDAGMADTGTNLADAGVNWKAS